VTAELSTPAEILRRSIGVSERAEIVVEDSMHSLNENETFTVLWQFAPEAECRLIEPGKFRVSRRNASMDIRVSEDWEGADLVAGPRASLPGNFEGVVSPHFRVTTWAPYLKLTAKTGHKSCLFTTTFLASRAP